MTTARLKLLPWVMAALAALYLYANTGKVHLAELQYSDIFSGESVSHGELVIDGSELYSFTVGISDVFDANARVPIHIQLLPTTLFSRIYNSLDGVRLKLDDATLALSKYGAGKIVVAETDSDKIFFVDNTDTQSMARLLWREQHAQPGVIRCFGKDFCNSINVMGNRWGDLQGPFLETDILPARSGLPRGRWAYMPNTILVIQSERAREIWVKIQMLRIVPDQKVRYEGPVLSGQHLKMDSMFETHGGKTMYPAADLLKLSIKPGLNRLELFYSSGRKSGAEQYARAAYLTAIMIKEAQ